MTERLQAENILERGNSRGKDKEEGNSVHV
jgi:hypothetical protein